MKTDYQNHLKSLFFTWTLCFALFLGVYLMLLLPAQKNAEKLGKILAERKQTYELIVQTEQEQTKHQLAQQINILRDGLHRYVAEPGQMADVIFNISQIANQRKVDAFNIKSKETVKNTTSTKFKYISEEYVDLNFETTFNNFASILNSLERNRPVVFVDKFSINRSDDKSLKSEVKMSLAVFVGQKGNYLPENTENKNENVELSKAGK